MRISVRTIDALIVVLLSALALLAVGLIGQSQAGFNRPAAGHGQNQNSNPDQSQGQNQDPGDPSTLTWG
jgi:hypothetical protein